MVHPREFSYRKACGLIKEDDHIDLIQQAARNEIRDDIVAFRDGVGGDSRYFDVGHVGQRNEFRHLITNFFRMKNLMDHIESVQIDRVPNPMPGRYNLIAKFRDRNLADEWVVYHRTNARLAMQHRRQNQAAPRSPTFRNAVVASAATF
jgi:hypothetical protein